MLFKNFVNLHTITSIYIIKFFIGWFYISPIYENQYLPKLLYNDQKIVQFNRYLI